MTQSPSQKSPEQIPEPVNRNRYSQRPAGITAKMGLAMRVISVSTKWTLLFGQYLGHF